MRTRERAPELRIDRVACTGHGVCAALLDAVTLDPWGYPIISDAVAAAQDSDVASAITLCPNRAIYLMGRTR